MIPLGQGTKLGRVEVKLDALAAPKPYRLVVTVSQASNRSHKAAAAFENDWTVWVFPAKAAPTNAAGVLIASSLDAGAWAQLERGGKGTVAAGQAAQRESAPDIRADLLVPLLL